MDADRTFMRNTMREMCILFTMMVIAILVVEGESGLIFYSCICEMVILVLVVGDVCLVVARRIWRHLAKPLFLGSKKLFLDDDSKSEKTDDQPDRPLTKSSQVNEPSTAITEVEDSNQVDEHSSTAHAEVESEYSGTDESESGETESDYESELNNRSQFEEESQSAEVLGLNDESPTEAYGDFVWLVREFNEDAMVERDTLKKELALQHDRMERMKSTLESAIQDLCPAIDRIALLRANLDTKAAKSRVDEAV